MAFSLLECEENVVLWRAQRAVTASTGDLREALTEEIKFYWHVRNLSIEGKGERAILAERTICPKAQGHEGLVGTNGRRSAEKWKWMALSSDSGACSSANSFISLNTQLILYSGTQENRYS